MDMQSRFEAGRLTVYLSGELDHHEAWQVMRRMDELLDAYLPRDCAINLAGLSFMDSSGIAVIIRAGRRMNALGGRIWIEEPARQPQRVIQAAGIERLVPIAVSR